MITEVAPLRASSSQVRAYISSLSASQDGAVSIQGDRGVMVLSYEKELTSTGRNFSSFQICRLGDMREWLISVLLLLAMRCRALGPKLYHAS